MRLCVYENVHILCENIRISVYQHAYVHMGMQADLPIALCVYMYICMYMHLCVCENMHVLCVNIRISVYQHAYVHMDMQADLPISEGFLCMFVYMCICGCVSM
jgi:hypothetical protein